MNLTSRIVTKAEAVEALDLWQMKGHRPLDAVRIFGLEGGGFMAGVTDYIDGETLLVAEHMNRSYPSYSALFSAIGALFDALDATDKDGA